MFGYNIGKKKLTTGFREPVEANGMKLSDDFFVTIDLDMLDLISKIQQETDPDAYKAKWEKKIGEKLFLYMSYNGILFSRWEPVDLDCLSEYMNLSEITDMRLADKDSLTRAAARKVAEIIYQGEGVFHDSCKDAAIAMMLYIRNGYNKKDFWKNFKKELILGLEELLESNGSFEIEDLLVANPFHDDDDTIMDVIDEAIESTKYYDDDNFVIFDSEIAEIIKQTKSYSEKEMNNAKGQYVIIVEDTCELGMSKKYILKDKFPSLLSMISIDTCSYYAACYLRDFLFVDDCYKEKIYANIAKGLLVYKKNGLPETDFWKNTCRLLIYLYEKGRF